MLRSDLTAAIARAVGTGLALALPVAAVAALRLFPPLEMNPADASGWLAPAALGLVALCSAISVIPLLGALVTTGRLSAGARRAQRDRAHRRYRGARPGRSRRGSPRSRTAGLALTLIIVAGELAVAPLGQAAGGDR